MQKYNNFPVRGNRFSRAFGRLGLRLLGGWKVVGDMPDVKKAIVPVAPHTSNWDFFVGVFAMLALGLKLSFLGKKEIFVFPVHQLLVWLGGIPVNRASPHDVVGDIAKQFEKREKLVLALSPEGTRSKVESWRTGFLYMARAARVPVVPVALDFAKKEIRIGQAIDIGDDLELGLTKVQAFTSQAQAKYPEKA